MARYDGRRDRRDCELYVASRPSVGEFLTSVWLSAYIYDEVPALRGEVMYLHDAGNHKIGIPGYITYYFRYLLLTHARRFLGCLRG